MAPKCTVGILSLGDMGQGISKLLVAHNFRVITNATGRSQYTMDRAKGSGAELVSTDKDLVEQSDYIFSIVPQRDCLNVADRVVAALKTADSRPTPLYFLDLNATSPLTAEKTAAKFTDVMHACRLLDGGIIGGPPTLEHPSNGEPKWEKPSIVVSGPDRLEDAPHCGSELVSVLNIKHVHKDIGPATGLKCVFAAMNKGYTGLAIQAMVTAEQLGVLPELQEHLNEFSPLIAKKAERGLVSMCPKAYRWVAEMDEIAETMQVFGGWSARDKSDGVGRGGDLFTSIGEIFKFVADDTPLGQERHEHRQRGTTAADVAQVCAENLKPEKEPGNSK